MRRPLESVALLVALVVFVSLEVSLGSLVEVSLDSLVEVSLDDSLAFLVARGLARSGRSRTKNPGSRILSRNVARARSRS